MSRHRPVRSFGALALLATVLLTGCGDPVALEVGGVGGGGSAGGSSNPPADPTGPGAGDESASGGAAGACPIGSWELVNESWRVALQGFVDASMGGGEVEISGASFLDWEVGGDYLLTARESIAVIRGSAEGQAFTQTIRHHGTEVGGWTGSGTAYRLDGTDSSGYESSATIEAGGASYVADDVAAEPWSGDLTVECTTEGMSTTVSDEGLSMTVDWVRR
jgi:hypothetical protein